MKIVTIFAAALFLVAATSARISYSAIRIMCVPPRRCPVADSISPSPTAPIVLPQIAIE